jgi:hypothetical protein
MPQDNDRADFSTDMRHYVIDGHRMEEAQAIDYLIALGMGINGAYQYLKSLIQQLNAKVMQIFANYGIAETLPDPDEIVHEPHVLDTMTEVQLDHLKGRECGPDDGCIQCNTRRMYLADAPDDPSPELWSEQHYMDNPAMLTRSDIHFLTDACPF